MATQGRPHATLRPLATNTDIQDTNTDVNYDDGEQDSSINSHECDEGCVSTDEECEETPSWRSGSEGPDLWAPSPDYWSRDPSPFIADTGVMPEYESSYNPSHLDQSGLRGQRSRSSSFTTELAAHTAFDLSFFNDIPVQSPHLEEDVYPTQLHDPPVETPHFAESICYGQPLQSCYSESNPRAKSESREMSPFTTISASIADTLKRRHSQHDLRLYKRVKIDGTATVTETEIRMRLRGGL